MSSPRMNKGLPEKAVASERQAAGQGLAPLADMPLFAVGEAGRQVANMERERIVSGLYDLRQRAFARAGGADAVCAALDERPSYLATISKCIHRSEENRRYPIDWDAALLLDKGAAVELVHGYAALAGFEATLHESVKVDEAEAGKAALDVLRELQRAGINTGDLLNRKLGVKPGTVKL